MNKYKLTLNILIFAAAFFIILAALRKGETSLRSGIVKDQFVNSLFVGGGFSSKSNLTLIEKMKMEKPVNPAFSAELFNELNNGSQVSDATKKYLLYSLSWEQDDDTKVITLWGDGSGIVFARFPKDSFYKISMSEEKLDAEFGNGGSEASQK